MSPDRRSVDDQLDDQKRQARTRRPNPDGGPALSQAGAMPAGSEMKNWKTAMPNPDATRPETMPTSSLRGSKRGGGSRRDPAPAGSASGRGKKGS